MARIGILGPSGLGKSTSIGKTFDPVKGIDIKGLDPETTFIVSSTSKPLPFRGSMIKYPMGKPSELGFRAGLRRIFTEDGREIAVALNKLRDSPFTNVVWDDANYVMQKWYMKNSLKTGWDAPKHIGSFMGEVFEAIEKYEGYEKNIIVMAHPEFVENKLTGRKEVKMKTTGNMVDNYLTPSGLWDIVLLATSRWDSTNKRVVKEFLTNEDEQFTGIKSPHGMFTELYIPNDLKIVVEKAKEYYLHVLDETDSNEQVVSPQS